MACDILVLSTGVYKGDVTGNLFIFESRLFSFLKPDYETNPEPSRVPAGKTLVFIQTQGGSKEWHADICERYEGLFKRLGFGDIYIIQAASVDQPWDIGDDIVALAEEIAEKCLSMQDSPEDCEEKSRNQVADPDFREAENVGPDPEDHESACGGDHGENPGGLEKKQF